MIRVLSLGAGVQSSVLLLMSARGMLPRLDAAVFADTQYEPAAVYSHLEWLKGRTNGIPLYVRTRGNLRQDALEFRQHRKSADGKRHASIPLFVLNADGSRGMVRRQCTSEYKIEVVERCVRREILGLRPKQKAPADVVVEQWFGITTNEASRAKPPGVYRTKKIGKSTDLLGRTHAETEKVWVPAAWKNHTYPMLGMTLWPDRSPTNIDWMRPMSRRDCEAWAQAEYPDHPFPRSACLCCPYRSNAEWRRMRDADPDGWADAVQFDRDIRLRDAAGMNERKVLAGLPFIHRTLVPLGEANIDDDDTGNLFVNECEGMCGV